MHTYHINKPAEPVEEEKWLRVNVFESLSEVNIIDMRTYDKYGPRTNQAEFFALTLEQIVALRDTLDLAIRDINTAKLRDTHTA